MGLEMSGKPPVIRVVLENSKAFKEFYKEKGPFAYALTSMDFPPVMLEPEEWLFSNSSTDLIKELMQYDKLKMRVVQAPFNPENRAVLRPEKLSAWKISHFPEHWNTFACDLFVPQGHLTLNLFERAQTDPAQMDAQAVEQLFFQNIETCLDQMGYVFLKPQGKSKYAAIHAYLDEWEADEKDAGLL